MPTDRKPSDADALAEMRKQYVRAAEYAVELDDEANADIKFVVVPGNQWDQKLKQRRGDRPCYEFPKLSSHIRQIVNEMREGRPQGKVRGTEESDRGLAEIMQGLCRNIESLSNAEQAYDVAYEAAVQGGKGVWRIVTDYADDDDFEQDIRVRPVRNPFSVKFDPAATEIDRRDGLFCFVEEMIPEAEFKRKYPHADIADFDLDDDCKDWREAGQVRVAEYWYKEPVKRRLLALSNGETVFADEIPDAENTLTANGLQIVKEREVSSHKVMMRLTSGSAWLTDPQEFPSKYIPIIPCWGAIQNIDGKDYYKGAVRESKDQQRLHNVHRTAMTEAVAKAPKAPFILKMKWIKGLENFWNRANSDDFPYIPIRDDADGVPERSKQAEVPAALIQLANMDNDDIKAATGQYDASLGARSNETSGVAINQRKQQGSTATFNYVDNLGYAIRYTYEILCDMIPRVYDTPRAVRILGEDGGAKWKQLYQEVTDPVTGQTVVLNDISKGKYDVVVTVGPSFATQRMEAVENYANMVGQLGGAFPPLAAILAYQVVKNTDLPGSEEVDKAMRKLLVGQGLLEPAEGEEPPPPPAPPPPDPRMEAQVQKMMAEADKYTAQADKTRVETQIAIPQAQAGMDRSSAETDKLNLDNAIHPGQLPRMARESLPPLPPPMQSAETPPQGGFFSPIGSPQP